MEQTESSSHCDAIARFHVRESQSSFHDAPQNFIVREVITSPAIRPLKFKGQSMVVADFEAMQAAPVRLPPPEELAKFEAAGKSARHIRSCHCIGGHPATQDL